MKIDYSSGLVLSNGDLLEATYDIMYRWASGLDPTVHGTTHGWIDYVRYNGCYITKPDGQKIWMSNSWYTHIEPLKP